MTQETARKILEQVREDYDIIAAEFSASRAHLWGEFAEFGKFVQPGNAVLDVGCGNGRLYEVLQDKNVSYLGIDVSEKLVQLARDKWMDATMIEPTKMLGRAKPLVPIFEVGDILTLRYQQQFDVVFGIAMLHHIPSVALRQKAAQRLYEALKPGGTLVLTVWNLWQPRFWWMHLSSFLKFRLPLCKRGKEGDLVSR